MAHFQPGFTFSASTTLSMLQAIQATEIATGLKLCLDAGDALSYPLGSGQTWFDRSGGGYDFLRGTTSAAQSTDPTFNGTVGQLSANEFFSFDGNDFFTLGQSNPTWVNNLHKNNAKFALLAWLYVPSAFTGGANYFLFRTASSTGDGISMWVNDTAGTLEIAAYNGPNEVMRQGSVSEALFCQPSAWNCIGIRLDEAVGANGLTWFANGVSVNNSAAGTYSNPSTGNAAIPARIGSGTASTMKANTRLATFSMWEGTIPSADDMAALYAATKGRFGL